ncbi:MAG: hypothetical protein ACR2ME_10065 [Acidimicrobiia bacterium]
MTRLTQVVLTLLILSAATPALGGFGFQLSEWEGAPGDVVEVEGSRLLTCCPANTPALAELLLKVDPTRPSSRVVLFTGVIASMLLVAGVVVIELRAQSRRQRDGSQT